MAELAPKRTLRSSRSTDAKSSAAPVDDDAKKKKKRERWESFFLSFFRFDDKEIECFRKKKKIFVSFLAYICTLCLGCMQIYAQTTKIFFFYSS